jgi:exodeoxyribonuclease III
MQITLTTWNINSVRLRMGLVAQLVRERNPDILCLQETKVEDGKFPLNDVRKLGFDHVAFNGQKGYHGVAIFSRLPFEMVDKREFCQKGDARHISIRLGADAGLKQPLTVHNFYVPAGGDIPDRELNPKFGHKLDFLAEMHAWFAGDFPQANARAVLVGDLNIAPFEHDVWSHKQLLDVVSHTPVETEAMKAMIAVGGWIDLMREFTPEPAKLYTWWSYRAADWLASNRGRRLDHIWASPSLAGTARSIEILSEARGWEKPSDHVPVTGVFEID